MRNATAYPAIVGPLHLPPLFFFFSQRSEYPASGRLFIYTPDSARPYRLVIHRCRYRLAFSFAMSPVTRSSRTPLTTPLPMGPPIADPDLLAVVCEYSHLFADVNLRSFCYVWGSNMRRNSGYTAFRSRTVKLSQEIHRELPEGE